MKTFILLTFCFTFFACGNDARGTEPVPSNDEIQWELVFQEDFDGMSVNKSIWNMYDGPGHAGNGLRKPSAFSVEEGNLVITAEMVGGNIVSGGMAHVQNYTYGKFEFRVRTEADPSGATSGVVLTWPQSEKWPADGENDIYETGTDPTPNRNPFHTFIHYDPSNKQVHYQHDANGTDWHIMAMEWFSNALYIYRDGILVYKVTDKAVIPQVPHHICLQLDAFKKEMTGKVKMYVDWVKIYKQK